MSHRANFITYAREHWTIIHLSFTSSLNIFSSSYAHFEQHGSFELERFYMFILVISHAQNSHIANVHLQGNIEPSYICHLQAVWTFSLQAMHILSTLEHFSNNSYQLILLYMQGNINHHTFVIYKQFEHFLFKLCTFWATWFLRAGKLKMFILAISHVLNVTQS